MRILLTNDDGIDSPGLHALRQVAGELSDDVWVVAPETNQSGASHSLTLHEPLRLRQIDERAFAVRGTPTDSVIMGVRHILKDKAPDLVLSGINSGANMAEDVTYSGTIAGAFEGTILGIRSIALSQAYGNEGRKFIKWHTGIAHAPGLIRKLLAIEWAPFSVMNVNFPDCEPGDVVATVVTTQGKRDAGLLQIDERHDTWGNPYYWLGFERRRSTTQQGTDLWAIYSGRISVTPLYLNLTHQAMREALVKAGVGSSE
ncbi:MAG TPA: 5'/3'-nucleotidase SurE [Hyphomicrobiaceae bacterium]|jgi:5'-nucleotidase|nr:5'/3'-nucleotidase SurE [Hyphomicrobiaceae bacterium]